MSPNPAKPGSSFSRNQSIGQKEQMEGARRGELIDFNRLPLAPSGSILHEIDLRGR